MSVIFAAGGAEPALAAKAATSEIPIVFASGAGLLLVRRPPKSRWRPDNPAVCMALSVRNSKVVINGLARCLRRLELNGSACFLLPDGRSIRGIAARRDVIDLDCDEIATTELAIDGEVEERKSRTRPST